ncbi:MAG: AtpZ/AtpI family protein [Actinobacteria bacterium]|nr:AtpZ/AtpI family protein [Actinomycetota bacterium]
MSERPGDRPSRSAERHREIGEAVGHAVVSGAFFGSLMAGLLLGWIADHFLGTRPVFIVIGIAAGAVVGFWRMWVDYGRAG